jgi:hypothetical protein
MKRTVTIIAVLTAAISVVAASFGIFSGFGPGPYEYESIRGRTIEVYGLGIYQHMSAGVAIQGIAQDYVTLFLAVPLLLICLMGFRRNSIRAHFLLAGTLGYFLVTYLFYAAMGMYNMMFLFYVALLGLSFFGFFISFKELMRFKAVEIFKEKIPTRFAGWLLIINAVLIALLWLSIILPPLFDGTLYPAALEHYTTLIVQGFDLGLLLPMAFVSGFLLLRKKQTGYLYGTVYLVFLALMMTALSAKIIAMAMDNVNVIPVIFIIPAINIITLIAAALMVRSIKKT